MRKSVLICFLAGLLCPVYAGINFHGLDLSGDNRLLFSASSAGNGADAQQAVFLSRLTDLAIQQITVFPEKIDLVDNGRSLLVRSVFGAALVPVSGGLPRPLSGFPSFVTGNIPAGSKADLLAVSSDGNWLLLVEPVSPAYGNLILVEAASGRRRLISTQIERPGRIFPACWSPDSRVFVYCKQGKLYYYSLAIEAAVDERYRLIGEGTINSVSWGWRGDFFYAKGSALFRVAGSELFTRAVYADFLEIGYMAGKLPLEFEPDFDFFWMAPDSRSLVFSKGGRNIFYYPLDGSHANDDPVELALPYIKLPSGAFGIKVLWPVSGPLTVIASVSKKGGLAVFAWRLTEHAKQPLSFLPLETMPDSEYTLSPDGSMVLVWGEQGAAVMDYQSWKPEKLNAGKTLACIWLNNREYIRADQWQIECIDISGIRRLLCLSGAQEYGFEEGGDANRILIKSRDSWFVSDGAAPWAAITNPRIRKASQVSGRYRVYLEKQSGFPYENIPMIRNTASVGTVSLFPQPFFQAETQAGQAVRPGTPGVFIRGLESGPREIALCFDLYDDDTGLSIVLEALKRFSVKTTFFMNGDFIRRHPESARGIAESGHETASLFYAPIDLSDSRYRIDAEFIARGLARNEDEYFRTSGAELGLLWHPPFYRVSAEIAQAALRAGYTTIGREVDPMDWLSRDEALRLGISRASAPATVERIVELKKPGLIIPIRLGALPGKNDYLFLYIDVLLDALLRSGYNVVPVSALIHSRR